MIATKKPKYLPAEETFLPPKLPSLEDRFWELYKCAFTGLHSQFEQYNDNDFIDGGGLRVYYDGEDKDSLMRSKHLVRVAYNSATEACRLLAEQDTLANFNKKVI